ncbi:hypothetical protein P280DRAFT_410753 [Massarina eburnea CBS 473.64]|uniref:Ilp is an apoptosis inhibitor n=1 Tax=Massarina eburnea CBS 473.64 TaxID=1395130 RepID=A0A6A6RKI2_9PLEO|nr:hypothetical protein P280DRAFT_410753 [Massarina eburnea CBS 473.64]
MANPGFTTHFSAGFPPFHPPRQPPLPGASSSRSPEGVGSPGVPHFDILEWHPAYQSCQRYFLDHAQHNAPVQAIAAFVNIQLPFQWSANPIVSATGPLPHSSGPAAYNMPWPRSGPMNNTGNQHTPAWVSLVPYIRRLVITGMDKESFMHGFFGDDWRKGVGTVHECERRNYLFAAKSADWASVKAQYDMSPHETVPFVKPLHDAAEEELDMAEKTWSQFMAMQDWMLGPRAPPDLKTPGAGKRPEV